MNRRAFTLVELLVVIAIIGMLISLLLPAMQTVRESTRRTQCANNLRQIGVALQSFYASQQQYPAGAVSKPYDASPSHPHTFYRWSALANLLPQLEKGNQYDALNLSLPLYGPSLGVLPENQNAVRQGIAEFLCPSDHGQAVSPNFAPTNYAACAGSGIGGGTPFATDGIFYVNSNTTPASIRDGTTNTLAFSESLLGAPGGGGAPPLLANADIKRDYAYTFVFPLSESACASTTLTNVSDARGFSWASGEFRCALYNHYLLPNANQFDCLGTVGIGAVDVRYAAYGWRAARSNHSGIVNGLYAGGAVRPCSNSVDLAVWRALSTRSGGEVTGDVP